MIDPATPGMRPMRPLPALLVLGAFTLVVRLLCLPAVREDNLTPDGARFLNIVRCITRGEGFSTPEAWPAWMNPERLPMPETFKEPGYPFAIAALTPLARDPFRAGQWISLLAGLLLPFAVYALGRRLEPNPWVGLIAGALAAASPVLIAQSAYVMAESAFALALTVAFLAAAPATDGNGRPVAPEAPRALDLISGMLFGLAFLVRAQALVAAPALALLLIAGLSVRVRLGRVALATAGALIAVAPLVARNLRVFGAPFHTDVDAFGLWPYVDQFAFTHSLDRPPAATGYALTHLPQVLAHARSALALFLRFTLPHDLLGHGALLVPLAVGAWIAIGRARVWSFALVYLACTAAFILSLNWVARYFASAVPLLCLLTALGAVAIARWLEPVPRARGFSVARMLALALALLLVAVAVRTVHEVAPNASPELAAARAEAPFLRAHLAPGEAVMAETTSYWAWFADRPAVHPVVADSARFESVMRRLRVRYAALPSSRLAEFAAHYPGGRLPEALVLDHENAACDISVFEVRLAR
jgi:hypothetical protein